MSVSSPQCQSKTGTCSVVSLPHLVIVHTISKVDRYFSKTAQMHSKVRPFSLQIALTELLSLLSLLRSSLQISKPVTTASNFDFEVVEKMRDCFVEPIFP